MSIEELRYSISKKIAYRLPSNVEEFIKSIAYVARCLEKAKGLRYSDCTSTLLSIDSCRNLNVADLCFVGPKPFKAVLKAIEIRYKVIESIARLESFALWKKMLAHVYSRYGRGRFKLKVARGKQYLAYELYCGGVVMVEDRDALNNFLFYRRYKKAARDTLKKYIDILRESTENPIYRKVARVLLKEARELRKTLRELESNEYLLK